MSSIATLMWPAYSKAAVHKWLDLLGGKDWPAWPAHWPATMNPHLFENDMPFVPPAR